MQRFRVAVAVDPVEEAQFGPYLVYERLGVGGMATVHRALERGIEGFERIVALKRLLPHLAEDATFIKAFVREAKLASLLHHVNIVQIYELGRVGTEYFISMEYIDGRDIRRLLRHARRVTGPPPMHVTVGLLTQLCDALDYAHTKSDDEGNALGLVHRDVSPSNLIITTQGHLKVIDFGIAKAQTTEMRTATGRVKGKLAYMAPEAISGASALDARSDLFAAGVIAHELLTARPLFARKNEYETLLKVQRGEVLPPSKFNQAVPPELDAIVMRALARDPEQRYASAAALRDDLGQVRRALKLQAGFRDVAKWIDWAFTMDAPNGGFAVNATMDTTGSVSRVQAAAVTRLTPTPTPRPLPSVRMDEEAAVEMAWGGGEVDVSQGPIVIDDVPDVSAKHLSPAAMMLPTPPPDSAHDDDDIPAHTPSHGALGSNPDVQVHVPAADRTEPALPAAVAPDSRPPDDDPVAPPPRPSQVSLFPAPAYGTTARRTPPPPSVRAKSTGPQEPIRETPLPPVVRAKTTGPQEPIREPKPRPGSVSPFARPDTTGTVPPVTPVDIEESKPQQAPARPRTTQPGVQAQVRSPAEFDQELIRTKERPVRPRPVQIGSAIIERSNPRSRWWIPFVAVALVGGGIAAYVFTRGEAKEGVVKKETDKEREKVTPTSTGNVKFVAEPGDVEIAIEGHLAHVGTPWATELQPGSYAVEIRSSGYKAWLTTIEVDAGVNQLVRVGLEPLGSAIAADATLSIASAPAGYDVVVDGTPTGQRTPVKKMTLKAGPHAVELKRNGLSVWRQAVNAKPSTNYEYNPILGEKRREQLEQQRVEREHAVSEQRVERTVIRPDAQTPSLETEQVAHDEVRQEATPVAPPAPSPIPAPTLPPVQPAPAPVQPAPAPAPVQTQAPAGPVTISSTMVNRVSGTVPNITKGRYEEDLPAMITVKVCIDTAGHVSSTQMLTKLDSKRVAEEILGAIKGWAYAPYKKDGKAVSACFGVTMRTKS